MRIDEIFSEIRNHMLQGVMLHSQLTDIIAITDIDFLYRLQRLRYEDESSTLKAFEKYYTDNYGKLITDTIPFKSYIPAELKGDINITNELISSTINYSMNTWVNWEEESKKFYEINYANLYDLREIAAAEKLSEIIADTDTELRYAKSLQNKMYALDYSTSHIVILCEEMLEEIKKTEKHFYKQKINRIEEELKL